MEQTLMNMGYFPKTITEQDFDQGFHETGKWDDEIDNDKKLLLIFETDEVMIMSLTKSGGISIIESKNTTDELYLRRLLSNDGSCNVCFEEKKEFLYICGTCNKEICETCFVKINNKSICVFCRSEF